MEVRYTLEMSSQEMPPNQEPRPGLMRSLGRFFGHVAAGVKASPERTGERREVSRNVEEREVETQGGKVTLRRTVIEEIEVNHDRPDGREAQP